MLTVIERRSSPRNMVSGLVEVRPAETGLARIEKPCALSNASSDSLYFFIESYIVRQRMRLTLTFPNVFDPSAIHREYAVEVVRQESVLRGRCGVAAKLLENIQLRLRDGLLVPETGFSSYWPLVTPAHIDVYA